MLAAGLQPPEIIRPGRIHRFPGRGKRPGNKAGWCVLFEDGRSGCFGDWSTGLKRTWRAQERWGNSGSGIQNVHQHQSTGNGKWTKTPQDIHQIVAAERAAAIWRKASPASSHHPYLLRKHIRPNGARIYKGALTLPVVDFSGTLTSLQFIASDGSKRLLAGGRKRGCFIPVAGEARNPARIIICEGWATGCTLAEINPSALVIAAIDAGNLQPVALMSRCHWPQAELLIAGDDDRKTSGNPGASKARAAAIAARARLAMPEWPDDAPEHLSDFNDLAVWLAGGGK